MSQAAAVQKESNAYSKRIYVVIDRDMTAKTSKIIWSHEKPILEEIFGEGRIIDTDPSAMDEGFSTKIRPDLLPHNKSQDAILPPTESSGLGHLFIGDPETEYMRLAEAYGKHAEINQLIVEKCYGRFSDGRFQKLLKKPKLSDLPVAQLAGLLQAFGVEIPKNATQKDMLALASEYSVEL